MRRGVTLLELVIVLTIVGLLTAMIVPRYATWADTLATARASQDIASFYARARLSAIYHGSRVRLEFREDTLRAVFEGVRDSTFIAEAGPGRHGVHLVASQPVIRIYPNGFGMGLANTKLVLLRGDAAESLTTSRLGRLKRWN